MGGGVHDGQGMRWPRSQPVDAPRAWPRFSRHFAPALQGFPRFVAFTDSHLLFAVPPHRRGRPADTQRGANTVHVTRQPRVKLFAAVIGGSAVVAAGAVTMAISQDHAAV